MRTWVGQDAGDFISYFRGAPVGRSVLADADEHTMGQITQALRDVLQPHQHDDGIRLAASAWVVTAARA